MGDAEKFQNEVKEALKELSIYAQMENDEWRAKAYSYARMSINGLDPEDFEERRKSGTLTTIECVGEATSTKINELKRTGKIEKLEEFRRNYQMDVMPLINLEGIGAKTLLKLHRAGVRNIQDLKKMLTSGILSSRHIGIGTQTKLKNQLF